MAWLPIGVATGAVLWVGTLAGPSAIQQGVRREQPRVEGTATTVDGTALEGLCVRILATHEHGFVFIPGPRIVVCDGMTDAAGRFDVEVNSRVLISGPGSSGSIDVLREKNDGVLAELVVEIWDPEGGRALRQVRNNVSFTNGLDLGSVALSAVDEARFLVRDSAGEPIQGALVVPPCFNHSRWRTHFESAPTGHYGETCLRGFPLGSDSAWVLAKGYVQRRVAVPNNRSEPIHVQMERAAVLEVRAVSNGKWPLDELEVDVMVQGERFFSGSKGPVELRLDHVSHKPNPQTGWSSEAQQYVFRLDATGLLVIPDIATNATATLRLLHRPHPGGASQQVAMEHMDGLVPGEQCVVRLP